MFTMIFSFQNIMRYKIRQVKNIQKDIICSFPGTRGLHEILLILFKKEEHKIEDVDESLLVMRVKTI